ncbi:MAG: FkbM family methyltransferase [Leptospiraceae bacterium]|nr:FkbM family methyltransferase [Leptospiraceae bacterium]
MTLDEYCENNKIYPNLIKIDAEGAEFKILRGMQKVLDRFHPKLLIEVHPKHLEKQGISLQSFFNFLLNHNYKIYLVERGGFEALNLTDEFSTYLRKGRINEYGTQINLHIFCRGIRQ